MSKVVDVVKKTTPLPLNLDKSVWFDEDNTYTFGLAIDFRDEEHFRLAAIKAFNKCGTDETCIDVRKIDRKMCINTGNNGLPGEMILPLDGLDIEIQPYFIGNLVLGG